jgi:BirA family biotin operon repressor/biotin-[acetyl-CoA-carboxylase] ligase
MPKKQTPFKRIHFQTIGSTQDYLTENATSLLCDTDQIVITASEQTKGRGTANRLWASPPEVNIYATFGIKIPGELTVYFDLIKSPAVMEMMALAVAKTLEELGFKPTIKWRNDILINGKKICGILCEPTVTAQGGVGLVGIGLNVNMPKEICDSLDQPVTSMAVEAGHSFDKEKVFSILENNVNHYINLYVQKNFASCVPEINARLAFIGKLIHVEDQFSKKIIEGICLGIDETGQLRIECEDKSIQSVRWGRIIKGELTYPEASKQKQEVQAKQDIQPTLLYTIGALGLSGLAYLLFHNYYQDKSSSAASCIKNPNMPSINKQEVGKRYFSTSSPFQGALFTQISKTRHPSLSCKPLAPTFFSGNSIKNFKQSPSVAQTIATGIKMLKR